MIFSYIDSVTGMMKILYYIASSISNNTIISSFTTARKCFTFYLFSFQFINLKKKKSIYVWLCVYVYVLIIISVFVGLSVRLMMMMMTLKNFFINTYTPRI